MFRKRSVFPLAALLIVLGASPLLAVPVYYTDRAAFDAATGPGMNFEGFEASFATAAAVVFPGFTVSETNGVDILGQLRDFPGLVNAITGGTGALGYDDNGSSIATFFAFTVPVTAFGLDVAASEAGTMTIGGSANHSLVLPHNTPVFWGVIDSAGLTTITFDMSGAPNVGFDSASYGVAVPEPASLLLLGTGLAGLVTRFRRRR